MSGLPVMDFQSLERHPQLAENGPFLEVEHEGLGRTLGFPRSPIDAVEGAVSIRPAPMLGADTEAVLGALPAPASGATARNLRSSSASTAPAAQR